jgi:hypothetical protein
MCQFNDKLIKDLALTVDPKNDDSMEVYGKLGFLHFDVDGLFDINQFHNAIFKILMLRAHDQYVSTGQAKLPEADREVTVNLKMTLRSPVVHSDQQLVEHGVVGSAEEARNLRGTIPVIDGEIGDDPQVQHILDLINTGQINLACQ